MRQVTHDTKVTDTEPSRKNHPGPMSQAQRPVLPCPVVCLALHTLLVTRSQRSATARSWAFLE